MVTGTMNSDRGQVDYSISIKLLSILRRRRGILDDIASVLLRARPATDLEDFIASVTQMRWSPIVQLELVAGHRYSPRRTCLQNL
jgi:hypothetical protein